MGQPWPEDGNRLDMPHILVKGAEKCTQAGLRACIDSLVQGVMAEVAAHKGWEPPKLETLEKKIQVLPYVASTSLVKQEQIR